MYFDKDKDCVSIIMPTYNSAKYVENAIKSVLAQSYKNFELIIVDDCSKDNTESIVDKYVKTDIRIKYIKLGINSGPAIARNKGIDLAKGTFISFLDSDDLWFSEKLSKQIKFMKDNEHYFTCTNYNKIDEDGNDINKLVIEKESRDYFGVLKNCPGNSTVIYNAKKLGKFKVPDIKKRNDYLMWLQIIKKADTLHTINEILSSHRVRKGSVSSNKFSLLKYHWNIYRKIEKLSLKDSVSLSTYWIFKSISKFVFR
ncbi:glycosyltransferase family 2 protein [Pisciglobus halotolerans]|nr:glycosyltransferase family 2 protein [Pisciglobus halotolerans]